MPVVPSRQLQVGLSGASAARVTTPQMKDATHEQNQQMGQAMQQFGADIGKIALDIQQEANNIRVQDAVNKATVEALDLTYGEGGYTHVKGENAMNRPDGKPMGVAYTEELEKRFTGIEDTLGNDAQRRAFRQWSGQYQGQFNAGLYKHEAEQAIAYGESVLRGTIGAQEQVIQHNWDKPEMLAASFGGMSAAFVKLKQMEGMSAEEIEAAYQGFVSGLHGYVVTQALQNASPDYALAYVQQYGSQMTAQDFESAQKAVGAEMDMRITGDVVNGIFAANPDASEQEMMALLSQTPEIAEHPSRIALARDDVMAKKQAQAQAQKQQREMALGQAQAALLENGGNWMALPLAVRNAIPPEMKAGVQAYARSVAKPVQVTNAQAYLALTDPDTLAEMSDADFEMARTKLAKGDFEYFARQRKVAKGGAGVVPSTPDVLNTVAVNEQVDSVMKMLKIDPRPEQSRPDQNNEYEVARNSVIRQKINKYVLSRQMAEGRNYTPTEIQAKVGEFIAEQVQGRSSVNGANGAVKRDIFTAQPSDMSEGVKSLLKHELMREGVENPTEGDIFQRYLQKEKFDKQEREGTEFVRLTGGGSLADIAGDAASTFGSNPLITSMSEGKGVNNPYFGRMVDGFTAYSGDESTRFEQENNQPNNGWQSIEEGWAALGEEPPQGSITDWNKGAQEIREISADVVTVVDGAFQLVLDEATDPTNYIPFGTVVKFGGKLALVVVAATKGSVGRALEIGQKIKFSQLGRRINHGGAAAGEGANKIVYEYGAGKVVATQADHLAFVKEVAMLDELNRLGIPALKADLVMVDGKTAMLMDRYAQGSKGIVRLMPNKRVEVVPGADASLLNQRSITDLLYIRQMMENNKITIHDLQFLIGKDGSVVIADPNKLMPNSTLSENNKRMFRLLIEQAQRNIK